MNKLQKDVYSFHKKFDCIRNNFPKLINVNDALARLLLIEEEAKELKDAIYDDDLPEIADALVDLMYVTLGSAVAYGINIQPVWNEVHKTNMAKEGGGKRYDGKILKPKNWEPPNIKKLLEQQGWKP